MEVGVGGMLLRVWFSGLDRIRYLIDPVKNRVGWRRVVGKERKELGVDWGSVGPGPRLVGGSVCS